MPGSPSFEASNSGSDPQRWFSTRVNVGGSFAPEGTFGDAWKHFFILQPWGGWPLASREVEARDVLTSYCARDGPLPGEASCSPCR